MEHGCTGEEQSSRVITAATFLGRISDNGNTGNELMQQWLYGVLSIFPPCNARREGIIFLSLSCCWKPVMMEIKKELMVVVEEDVGVVGRAVTFRP